MPGWVTAGSVVSAEEPGIRKESFRPMSRSEITDVGCFADWPDVLMVYTVMKLDLICYKLKSSQKLSSYNTEGYHAISNLINNFRQLLFICT